MNPKHIIITTVMILLMCSGTASAWLSGYDHRMNITVNNSGGSTLTDYQFNFTNDTNILVAAGHMQASGADCRITDSSDNLIPFWNETAFNAANTKIWANDTLATGDNIFYMYYGNTAASSVASIAGMAYKLGDDFSGIGVGPNLAIDSSLDIGGFSCWANARIYQINDTAVWIYNTVYESTTESHMVRHVYNITTNTELSETSLWNNSSVICSTRGFEKIGSTSHILYFYETSGGANISLRKRESADGLDFNVSTQATLVESTGEVWADTLKISDTEFWIYLTDRVNATHHDMYRIVVNESGYNAPTWLFSDTVRNTWAKPKKYGDTYYLYHTAGDPSDGIYAHASSDGLNFGARVEISAGAHHAPQVDKVGDVYYLFYDKDYTSLRVATCATPNGTFVYQQQLYSGYYIPSDTMIFDADKILMVHALMPENVAERLYVDQLSVTRLLDTSKWDGNTSDATISDGIMSFTGDPIVAIRSIEQFGIDVSLRAKVKFGVVGDYTHWMGLMQPDEMHFGAMTVNYLPDNQFGTNAGGGSDYANTNIPLDTWFISDILIDGGTSSAWFYDSVEGTASPKTSVPCNGSELEVLIRSHRGTSQYNWLFARKYTATEPTSSLGAEENAPAGSNDIILAANQHGMLRKNVIAAETFSTIAAGIDHDRCYTWWDSTNNRWESYRVGYSYNAAKSVPEHDSYFVLMDGTGTTISCSIAAAETVAIPAGYYATYLRESTNKTLTAIKSDMGGNVDDLWAFNSTAGAWTDTGAYSVLPNQGLMVNSSTGFNWDGAVP